MPISRTAPLFLFLVLGLGCNTPEPEEKASPDAFKVPFDFIWQSSIDELKDGGWQLATQDRTTKTIETEWNVNLSPISHTGRRARLKVTYEGTDDDGWKPKCSQETEENTNEEQPLKRDDADWSAVKNNGALASIFLQNLSRRITPNERWRDRAAR